MNFRFPLWSLTLAGLLAGCAGDESAANRKRPNIIFIMADDLGYADLGCYGQKVIRTPHLDRLAGQGIRFTQCYAGAPVCAPCRSVLMTGRHTGHTTVRGNFGVGGVVGLGGGEGRVPLKEEDVTVAEILSAAGYHTAMVGKWGLGEPGTSGEPGRKGFDEFYGFLNQRRAHSYYPDYIWRNTKRDSLHGNSSGQGDTYVHDLFTAYALDYLERMQDSSFFLYLPYTVPHDEYEIPDLGIYKDSLHWGADAQVHAAMITRLDRDVGQLLDALDRLDLTDNTIVFFCSDNGAAQRWEGIFDSSGPLRGRKRDLTEGGLRSPMIVRYPGVVPAGVVSDAPWHFMDVLPTLADLAGISDIPANVDGKDIFPLLLGKDMSPRTFYWEFYKNGFQQAVRQGKWKAIKLGMDEPWELYDLDVDQAEQLNVASEHPALVEKMAAYAESNRIDSPHWPVNQEE